MDDRPYITLFINLPGNVIFSSDFNLLPPLSGLTEFISWDSATGEIVAQSEQTFKLIMRLHAQPLVKGKNAFIRSRWADVNDLPPSLMPK